ncbi:oxidoreductase [Actinoplanes sp. ATCC 53533]|uniref:SDR family NAD(P)-dependent oxidoreductase n=1 Tax=Actinoplanes sp. ATCC 53533 TaxID=1288362 RepID=UPI000F78BF65|nr:SDR family NAD(P)-dependent oxidoreductase [Actinoplanes sp. ATCC 53533]RSM50448.1 oxidoreductase [Actinoplanes sp. ATCC 53533]
MKQDKSVVVRRSNPANLDLTGTNVAIVGGTGGIGRAFARLLAARGAHVLVVGRTFRDAGLPGIEFLPADLNLMREAERVAARLPAETLDLVVLTTGIFAAPARQETSEGIERDMAVSYLSRLVILRGIAERLGTRRPAIEHRSRVFVMGYPGTGRAGTHDDLNAEKSYHTMAVHMNTVAGNEMLVLDAARRYPHLGVFGLNPGFIKSDIRGNLLGAGSLPHRLMEGAVGLLTPSTDTYAERIVPLLVSPDLDDHSGVMFNRKGAAVRPTAALTDDHIEKFLSASTDLVTRTGVRLGPSADAG